MTACVQKLLESMKAGKFSRLKKLDLVITKRFAPAAQSACMPSLASIARP